MSSASAHVPSSAASASVDGHAAASASGSACCTASMLAGSTTSFTMPTPLCSAARPASNAAPAMPCAPPMIATLRRTPLCASAPMGGTTARTYAASASGGAPSSRSANDPSPMSTTTMTPHRSRASSWPRLMVPNVTVRSARGAPSSTPVVASSPLGTSSATTYAPLVRAFAIAAHASAMAPRGAPWAPVPSRPSTTMPGLRPGCAASASSGAASAFSACASAVRGDSTSMTRTGNPATASVPATTQASPPLLPPPA